MASFKYTVADDYKKGKVPATAVAALLTRISKETGKSPYTVLKEWAPLSIGPGKLKLDDYVYYRLFDDAEHNRATRARFISDTQLHWKLVRKRVGMHWLAATEDKWLLYSVLEHHGIPVPRTLAVVDNGIRSYGRTPVIGSTDDLRVLLRESEFPLFMKPVRGIWSSGALLLRDSDGDEVLLQDGRKLSVEDLFATLEDQPYLIQAYLRNHGTVAELSSHLATVRCYNFIIDGAVRVEATLIKLVGADNIADNYWRQGNMLAAVDPAEGRLTRVVTGTGFDLRMLEAHPVSGRSFGEVRLPFWRETLALNEECARLYASIEYSSTDIAITPDGPFVVEVNIGGAFTLPQLATGRGFLSDSVAAFFGLRLRQG